MTYVVTPWSGPGSSVGIATDYGPGSKPDRDQIKQKLLVFERKILRRIFGPTQKANGEWRL